MIQFAYTILYVTDVARSVDFYCTAFGLELRFITPDNSYAELQTAGVRLAFASLQQARQHLQADFTPANQAQPPFGIEIGFSTPDVQHTYQQALLAGATAVCAPNEQPHGQTVSYVRDPDGFLVEICSPM